MYSSQWGVKPPQLPGSVTLDDVKESLEDSDLTDEVLKMGYTVSSTFGMGPSRFQFNMFMHFLDLYDALHHSDNDD